MNQRNTIITVRLLAAIAIGLSSAIAAKPEQAAAVPLTEAGQKLEAKYAAMLKALEEEIATALPKIEGAQQAAFLKAYEAEAAATTADRNAMHAQNKSKDKAEAAKAGASAKEALARALANAQAPAQAVLAQLNPFLTSDKLDAQLVKLVVLAEATPRGLAEFAQQGKEQEALLEKLLADADLMKQMVVAAGASGGKYGQAMQIFTDIQKASSRGKDDILQRFALGTSLEHAVPVVQRNAVARTDAPTTVDPVKRYLHYEKAYLAGELDPGFKDLSVWDCRFVGNGDEPDEMLAWGREMLRNYHPDHIQTADYRWRYVEAVKTDVKYGSQDQKNDLPRSVSTRISSIPAACADGGRSSGDSSCVASASRPWPAPSPAMPRWSTGRPPVGSSTSAPVGDGVRLLAKPTPISSP